MSYNLPLEQVVHGIRFQPIFSLSERRIYAWEVLSILQPDLNREDYFKVQSIDIYSNLLCWQLHVISGMKNMRRYFLIYPPIFFVIRRLYNVFLPSCGQGLKLKFRFQILI